MGRQNNIMKRNYYILLLLMVVFTFLFFPWREDTIDSNELNLLRKENKILRSKLERLKAEREDLRKFLDNLREIEMTSTSIYSIRSDYFQGSTTTSLRGKKIGGNNLIFSLDQENLYDFTVSNDNQLIAVLIFDKENMNNQKVIIYSHDGKKLYEYKFDDFLNKADHPKYLRDNLIIFHGFSNDNKYLWGGLPERIEISVFFSIDLERGKIKLYNFDNYDEYQELLDKHPYNE